jgi:hypothetical protein
LFEKTGLLIELILTNYFTVSEGKIYSLIVIRNVHVGGADAPNHHRTVAE